MNSRQFCGLTVLARALLFLGFGFVGLGFSGFRLRACEVQGLGACVWDFE